MPPKSASGKVYCEQNAGSYHFSKDDNLTTHLLPLIKWVGGKEKELKQIEHLFPKNYTTYIEPFAGGASVYFYLNHSDGSVKKNVISDVHPGLIEFYKQVGSGNARELHNMMSRFPNDEKTYYQVRDKIKADTPLEKAFQFYYLRKTCFRGMMRYNNSGKFNVSFGKYKSINYEQLLNPAYEALLKNTEIRNDSFEKIFTEYEDPANFCFLDPPYDSPFSDYGYCQFDREYQQKLFDCFRRTRNKCLMVISETDFIRDLYKDYISEKDCYAKKYAFKLYAGRVGDEIDKKHLVIKNY